MRVAVLNLMPMKEETETDIVRALSGCEEWVELRWMRLRSHKSKHVAESHLEQFYEYFDELSCQPVDGLIVTGAPVEQMPFTEVDYWAELQEVMNWSARSVNSVLYICWAAQAGLYHGYGIDKYPLPKKKFGIFRQTLNPQAPSMLFEGFDSSFPMPHSRHTELRTADIEQHPSLELLAAGKETGVSVIGSRVRDDFFITGHIEYAVDTLDREYHRDMGKRTDVDLPEHYYPHDNPEERPLPIWQPYAQRLFRNWVHHFVNHSSKP